MDLSAIEILKTAKIYISNEKHLGLIEDAFEYASKKHKNQVRKSGEPYLIHPLAVANILAEYHFGPYTIISGLLHDVL